MPLCLLYLLSLRKFIIQWYFFCSLLWLLSSLAKHCTLLQLLYSSLVVVLFFDCCTLFWLLYSCLVAIVFLGCCSLLWLLSSLAAIFFDYCLLSLLSSLADVFFGYCLLWLLSSLIVVMLVVTISFAHADSFICSLYLLVVIDRLLW